MKRKLVLENGLSFIGEGFGSNNEVIAELVVNTSVVGYQEILSDLSYCGCMICMTYPLIGNYGMTDEDYEAKNMAVSALIVKEYNDTPSNFRYTKTLSEVMEEQNITGICGLDTRYITRVIKEFGTMKAIICDVSKSDDECLKQLKAYQPATNLVEVVSTKKIWYSRTSNHKYTIVTVDCGTRLNLVKKLNQAGCNVVVVPYNTKLEEIMKYKPNGLFISNGPGNPADNKEVIELIKEAKGKLPILGIGLGMNCIALAYGAKLNKMKFGHRGVNYPVKNLVNGKIDITAQNNSYAIDKESIAKTTLKVTHINVLDNQIEGVLDEKNGVIAVEFNPETGCGISEEEYIINKYISIVKSFGGKK